MSHPTIDIAAPNNASGLWTRDVSAILAADPAAASATWRMQIRRAASDPSVVLEISAAAGSLSLVSGVLIISVPLTTMQRIAAGAYVWDGVYTTASGRTMKWAAGAFVVEQGVTR